MPSSFEDKIDVINHELQKRRGGWQFNSLSYMDFDDVCQILKRHIFIKWDQWDQRRPLVKWLNRVISNQLYNLIRNNYGNVAPPCSGCPFSLWGEHCEHTPSGLKCNECSLYKNWSKSKKSGYYIKMASSIQSEEYIEKKADAVSFDSSMDVEGAIPGFHELMRKNLNARQYKAYKSLYMDFKSEKETIKLLGIKDLDSGLKKLGTIKRAIIKVAHEVLKKHDIFSCNENG